MGCAVDFVLWLSLDHIIQELRVKPVPDLRQGPAGDQDVLDGVWACTEVASWAERRLIRWYNLIEHDVAGEKFYVHSQFLNILGVEDILKNWMCTIAEATKLDIQIFHL